MPRTQDEILQQLLRRRSATGAVARRRMRALHTGVLDKRLSVDGPSRTAAEHRQARLSASTFALAGRADACRVQLCRRWRSKQFQALQRQRPGGAPASHCTLLGHSGPTGLARFNSQEWHPRPLPQPSSPSPPPLRRLLASLPSGRATRRTQSRKRPPRLTPPRPRPTLPPTALRAPSAPLPQPRPARRQGEEAPTARTPGRR